MSINTFLDKVFYINLDSRPDRRAECERELATYQIEAERFPGVQHPCGGNDGCTMAHRNLLQYVAQGPWEKVLVLEDDFEVLTRAILERRNPNAGVLQSFDAICVATPSPQNPYPLHARFDYMVEFVPPDWDVLYLGGGYAEDRIAEVHEHVIKCGKMFTTSSYGITRRFAKVWTDLTDEWCKVAGPGMPYKQVYAGAIDVVFGRYAHDYNYYIFRPRLMIQRPGKSDIQGLTLDYTQSMTDYHHERGAPFDEPLPPLPPPSPPSPSKPVARPVSCSRAGQDLWVLERFGHKRGGTYIDCGCGHPAYLSNTYMLDKEYAWKGLLVDRDAELCRQCRASRSARTTVVHADGQTLDWDEVTRNAGLPTVIDYLSLDCDERTASVLEQLLRSRLIFHAITIKHDAYRFGDELRARQRALLQAAGYVLTCPNVKHDGCEFEDWWTRPSTRCSMPVGSARMHDAGDGDR